MHLCADEVAIVSIDTRTGRLSIRDTGDLAAAGRGPRFSAISDKLNESPNMLFDALIRLRYNVRTLTFSPIVILTVVNWQTITDIVEQKANYLGFQVFRHRNFPKEGLVFSIHIHALSHIRLRDSKAWTCSARYDVYPTRQLPHALPRACPHR